METGQVMDPHNSERGRSVSDVTTGKQAARPAHEYGTVSPPPEQSSSTDTDSQFIASHAQPPPQVEIELKTAPGDWRFPVQNQTRRCYTRYVEYHRCIKAKGKGDPACEKFARYYRSLCPLDWIQRWNEQVEAGTFPGPI